MGLETAADLFQEIVCCPRCRGPLPEGGACGSCGAPWHLEGPVLNFLGDEAFRTPKSRELLRDILGESVTVASVPGGYYGRAVAETAAEAGIRVLFNSEPTTRTQTVG